MAMTAEQYKQAYQDYKEAGEFEKADKIAQLFTEFQAQQPSPVIEPNQPVDYQFSESAKNFLPSLGGAFGDLYHAVTNPIDTASTLGELFVSGRANLGQEIQDVIDPDAPRLPDQEMGEAFAGMLADRYGSTDALKKTAMEDPAGILLDASSILTGGGGLMAKAPGIAGKAGQQISKAGQMIDPITGALKAPAAVIEKVAKKPLSHILYESAMKPSTTLSPKKRKQLVEAGLDLGATPAQGSVSKLEGQKQALWNEVADLENQANIADALEPQGLFKHVDDVKAEYAPPVINAMPALKAVDDVVDQMQEAIFMNGGNALSVKELGRIKRNIYQQLNYDKSSFKGAIDQPSEKAMKAIARAAKEAIEEIVPAVKKKNQLAGSIYDVQKNLQWPAAHRIGNKDVVGLGLPMATTTGQVVGGNTGGILATALGILDRPVIKSKAALGTNRLGKAARAPIAPLVTTNTALMGRLEQAMEEERKKQ